jgi:CDP-paratose 2-epimerase
LSVAVITGSTGLVGSQAVRHFAGKGLQIVGIDNDMRRYFFGAEASTGWMRDELKAAVSQYEHHNIDIRDEQAIFALFRRSGSEIALVVHAAAQPSHDWAAREPLTDFSVNAGGTLVLLEATRQFAPQAAFIFCSTNKVYGDTPNRLPLIELESRWKVDPSHRFAEYGISEEMAIDGSLHSLFGCSKVAADVMVQEYGRYFGINTVCFRAGCITGPQHAGAEQHGFLHYLMKCCATGKPYQVLGYKGKQVRDNIHCDDLVRAFDFYFERPRPAAIYNIGGSRFSNCSMLEAIAECETICSRKLEWNYAEQNRVGDHLWWISDIRKFQVDYPGYRLRRDVPAILREIYESNFERWEITSRAAQA